MPENKDIEAEFLNAMRKLFNLVRFYETDSPNESERQLRFKYKTVPSPQVKEEVQFLLQKIREMFAHDKEILREVFRAACFFQDMPDRDDIFCFHLKYLKKQKN